MWPSQKDQSCDWRVVALSHRIAAQSPEGERGWRLSSTMLIQSGRHNETRVKALGTEAEMSFLVGDTH